MATKRRTLRWIASGIFAAALFAAASPAHARDGWGRHGFGPRVRVSRFAFPHVRYFRSRFDRPYYYAASPYYYSGDYYAGSPYYYGASPYYYAARRAYWPRAVYRHRQYRHRY